MGFLPSASVPDSEYLLTRSSTEARLAAAARTEQAAEAHHRIASSFLAKLFGARVAASLDAELGGRSGASAGSGAVELSDLRFADLTSVPQNDELTRILRNIR